MDIVELFLSYWALLLEAVNENLLFRCCNNEFPIPGLQKIGSLAKNLELAVCYFRVDGIDKDSLLFIDNDVSGPFVISLGELLPRLHYYKNNQI